MFDNLFYVITMQTKNNKILYLMSDNAKDFKWTFDYEEGVWFETEQSARDFASQYFKNFKEWSIKEVYAQC